MHNALLTKGLGFIFAILHRNEALRNGEITPAFTGVDKSCTGGEFFKIANMSFNITPENKILMKISEFTVLVYS